MRKLMEHLPYLAVLIIVYGIIAYIITIHTFDKNLETLHNEVQNQYNEKIETCSHSWQVLDKDDNEWDSVLVACEDCGAILIADYRNHKFIERK